MAVLLPLAGCGKDTPSTPTPTPTPTPAPAPQVVLSASYAIEVNHGYFHEFTISGTRSGTLEVTVDYTYSDSIMLIWLAKAPCSVEQLDANQCQIVASSFAGQKPRRLAATSQAAGNYVLFILNAGPNDEGVSYQGVFTANAAGLGPSVTATSGRRGVYRIPASRLEPSRP
jgi:hypothetical protein